MEKAVFPDASVFLHCSPLDEIDLPQLFDYEEVEVLLTSAVTEELLRHQWNHPAPELRQRAKESLKRVEKWLEGRQAIGRGVTINFLSRRPNNETMEKYRLNWQYQGDVLLGTLLEYQQARADEGVILLTGDSGLALRASSLGIEVAVPPSEHTLAEAKNRLPEEEQKLLQELAGFRYRTPSLLLSFAGGKNEVTMRIEPQLDSLTATMRAKLVAVADKMHREESQYQAKDEVAAAYDDLDTLAALVAQKSQVGGRSFLDWVAEEEAERFQRELEAYPEKFERYLRRCLEMINEHRRTIRLDLEMENAGGAPAENVLLVLTLPEGLEWHWRPSDRDMPAPPAPPTRPGEEGEVIERGFHIGEVSSVPSRLLDRDYISGEVPAGASPVISEASNHLQWELGTYHYHQSRLLGPLYVRFSRAENISDFAIAWEVQEKNNSSSVRGQLQVSVDAKMSAREAES